MRKLRLDLESLAVQTFETTKNEESRGTIQANDSGTTFGICPNDCGNTDRTCPCGSEEPCSYDIC